MENINFILFEFGGHVGLLFLKTVFYSKTRRTKKQGKNVWFSVCFFLNIKNTKFKEQIRVFKYFLVFFMF